MTGERYSPLDEVKSERIDEMMAAFHNRKVQWDHLHQYPYLQARNLRKQSEWVPWMAFRKWGTSPSVGL
jgi:hypothetical protein